MSVPYQNDAGLNATFLLQKQIFQLQSSTLSNIISSLEKSNSKLVIDSKIPPLLSTRALPDEYTVNNRYLENEEITILGFLDASGKLSVSSRLNELMLLMTRITKAEHRALCIYIITSKTTDHCKKDFIKFGGLRIVKRWLKIAEDGDLVTEMTALVKLCNKLPFDEVAIREIGIGKVIRKLLKFQSPSNGDLTGLRAQVEALMSNWRSKQQDLASTKAAEAAVEAEAFEQRKNALPAGLVLAISDRLVKQRGLPVHVDANDAADITDNTLDKNESKEELSMKLDTENNVLNSQFVSHHSLSEPVAKLHNHSDNKPIPLAGGAPKPVSILPFLRAAQNAAQPSGAEVSETGNAPSVLVVKPPMARERKPLDMAEKARSMLAMRAQHALSGGALGGGTVAGAVGAEPGSPDGPIYSEHSAPLSPSTSNVLSILSAVGKARIASGLRADLLEKAPPLVLKGALKKPAASDDGVKKEKKVIHWADENGGLLREVRTIEVAKIKRSTAHYSSTRELSKRERLAEKETHMSKAEDAMQKNTEWRTPTPLQLSIVVLDNISIVADSAEKVAQEKRLAHVLEVRYALDTQIPMDPDESPSVRESAASSSSARSGSDGTNAGDDSAPVASIPWYAPGTEPPPEEVPTIAPVSTADLLFNSRNGYLDDTAMVALMAQLPYSLQTLDMSTLRTLLQDPAALQSILRPDGTVDELNLSAFQQRSFQADMASRDSNHYDPYNDGFSPSSTESGSRRSRWGNGGDSGPPGGFPPPGQTSSYEFDYDYNDPYGFSRSNSGSYHDRPLVGWNGGYDAPAGGRGTSVVDLRDRRHAAPQGRFPTTKAATACRFFNTPKGCQFGDKCSFGHFLPTDVVPRVSPMNHQSANDAYPPAEIATTGGGSERANSRWGSASFSSASSSVVSGPGAARRFGDAPRQLSGPGSRLHSQTVAPTGTVVVDLAASQDENPPKRIKKRFH